MREFVVCYRIIIVLGPTTFAPPAQIAARQQIINLLALCNFRQATTTTSALPTSKRCTTFRHFQTPRRTPSFSLNPYRITPICRKTQQLLRILRSASRSKPQMMAITLSPCLRQRLSSISRRSSLRPPLKISPSSASDSYTLVVS